MTLCVADERTRGRRTGKLGGGRGTGPRVVAMTMASNEADMLPRWIDYYGGQLGVDNLVVLDDNSVDASTDDLPCTLYRLPGPPWKVNWERTRRSLVNGLARGLLACYDVVVFTDVDEFLVPDPARYEGLVHYLEGRREQKVIAPLGLNVLHNPVIEPSLDPSLPLLAQRQFVKFAPAMCKPLLKRIPADWMVAFHGIKAPFAIDPDVLLLHLKYYDVTALRAVSEHRRAMHETDSRGSPHSAWPLGPEALTSRLLSWVETPDGHDIPEFDAAEVDLTEIVRPKAKGFYRTHGPQLPAMDKNPLRRLPERFLEAF